MKLLALLCLWLFAVHSAAADAITAPITFEDAAGVPMTLQQAVDAAGDSVYLLFDLGSGQEWTTPANGAVTENLMLTILTLGGDSAQIAELFQPGAVFGNSSVDSSPLSSVPEPATLILLCGAFAVLSVYRFLACAARKDVPI